MDDTMLNDLDDDSLVALLDELEKLDDECVSKINQLEGDNNE